MNKIANMRTWSERMGPAFGSRPNLAVMQQHHKLNQQGVSPIMPPPMGDSVIHHAFNVPFASDLVGPDTEDILHATTDAVLRWTHPAEAPDDVPVHDLPVHAENLARLRKMCKDITTNSLHIEAYVISANPKHLKGQVTTVCLSGLLDLVWQTRERILNETPLSLVCNLPISLPCFASPLQSPVTVLTTRTTSVAPPWTLTAIWWPTSVSVPSSKPLSTTSTTFRASAV